MAIETDRDRKSPPALATVAAAISLALALALCFSACQTLEKVDPLLRERVVSIDARALDRFLEQIGRLAGTPAARYARTLQERTASCAELWAHFDATHVGAAGEREHDRGVDEFSPPDLSALDCPDAAVETSELATLVRQRRGEADGFISWPLGDDGRLELRLDVDPQGGLEIDGRLVAPSDPGIFSLFVPGRESPAAPAITPASTLIHLRMRPANGIGLSKLIPAGSQADRLFALKGRLLEGALLTGTWELAFMPPAAGGAMPLALGVLHHRLAGALQEALDEALSQLEATWPIKRSPRRFAMARQSDEHGTLEGGCFLDLPLLPELAPCWVVTPEALLVGYRGEAIDEALAAPAVSSAPGAPSDARAVSSAPGAPSDARAGGIETPNAAGRIDVHLDRMQRMDARLLGPEAAPHPGEIFSKFELRMSADSSGQINLHARLRRRS